MLALVQSSCVITSRLLPRRSLRLRAVVEVGTLALHGRGLARWLCGGTLADARCGLTGFELGLQLLPVRREVTEVHCEASWPCGCEVVWLLRGRGAGARFTCPSTFCGRNAPRFCRHGLEAHPFNYIYVTNEALR